jgi:hypothetical protein
VVKWSLFTIGVVGERSQLSEMVATRRESKQW